TKRVGDFLGIWARRLAVQDPDHRHRRLLRARGRRPNERRRHGRAARQRDEGASVHSITSSAMASSPGEKVTPRALAVWRLMMNSNFVGCTIGRSAGLAPLRMRPV